MPNELALRVQPNTPAVPADSGMRLVYLLVGVNPTVAVGQNMELPLNLAIVIDKSESMTIPVLSQEQFAQLQRMGQVKEVVSDGIPVWSFRKIPDEIRRAAPSNLEMVKQALYAVGSNLEAHDRWSVIAFASRAVVLAAAQNGSNQHALQAVIDNLDSVAVGDETNMAEGIGAGLGEVQKAFGSGALNRLIVLTDGYTLNPDQVVALASRAASQSISISTMGIGSDFNENLLVAIADKSGGNAYFARQPKDIPPAFQQEMSAVASISFHHLELAVKLASGVELRRAHLVRPVISDLGQLPLENRQVNIPMRDLETENPPAALLELLVPARPAGSYRIAELNLSYEMPGAARQSVAAAAMLEYTADASRAAQMDAQVMNFVERVSVSKLQTRALNEAAAGDIPAATTKLRQAATRLLQMGEAEMAGAAEREANNLERQGQVSAEGAKEIKYATRRLTQRLDR